MINYIDTQMGKSYVHYLRDYLAGLATGAFDTYQLNETSIIGINRKKNVLPKTNLPYVVGKNDPRNTHDKTIVLTDASGLRDTEADLRYVNSILTAVWEDPLIAERFINVRMFATKAYMMWVGRGMKGRYSLNIEDGIQLDILLAVYFYCANGDAEDILDPKRFKSYADIAEITGAGANRVKSVIDRFKLNDGGEFSFERLVASARDISDDTRNKISYTTLTSTCAQSWYGEGGVFYCNLALEYPPMFMTLLYFSLMDKSYTGTRFGKVISEFAVGSKSQQGVMFTRQLHTQIKAYNIKST